VILDITYAIRVILGNNAGTFARIGSRMYPQVLPATKVYPLLSYHQVSVNALSSHSGSSKFINPARVQLDVYDNTDLDSVTTRDLIKAALIDYKGTVVVGGDSLRIDRIQWANDVKFYDPELQKHWRAIDLLCWCETAS